MSAKATSYRHKDMFAVTVTVPCPVCNAFHPEPDVKLRSQYIYGEGYFKLHSCNACFEEAVKAKRAEVNARPNIWG